MHCVSLLGKIIQEGKERVKIIEEKLVAL